MIYKERLNKGQIVGFQLNGLVAPIVLQEYKVVE